MKPSIVDALDISELRMWALSALWQHPQFIPTADGTLFISTGCAFSIFTAMRSVYESGNKVTLPAIFEESGFDWDVAIGLSKLVDVPIADYMVEYYLEKLSNRFERDEGVRHAA